MKVVRAIKKVFLIAKSWLGSELLDPIEIYYDTNLDLVFPINSKCGNSSVKLALIQRYKPDYVSSFPDIHHVDPAVVTDGKLQRIYFKNYNKYGKFCIGKTVKLVVRNPEDRFYSFYLGVVSKRNLIYRYPSGTHRIFRITEGMSLKAVLNRISWIPDSIADRHFRSQAFYLLPQVKFFAKDYIVISIEDFLQSTGKAKEIRLNDSRKAIPQDTRLWLQQNRRFQTRYSDDYLLYRSRTTFPNPLSKN